MKKFLTAILALSLISSACLFGCSKRTVKETDETDTGKKPVAETVVPEIDESFPFEYRISGSTASITLYKGEETEVVIPAEINDVVTGLTYAVDTIGECAFLNSDLCESITKVTIPEGVKTIEMGAFQNCKALETAVLPESLETIEDKAFYNCTSLKEINLGANVTSIGTRVFGDAFVSCPWYDSAKGSALIVGDGILLKYNNDNAALENVKQVAYRAFAGCTAKTVTFSAILESIHKEAFDAKTETQVIVDAECPFAQSDDIGSMTFITIAGQEVQE